MIQSGLSNILTTDVVIRAKGELPLSKSPRLNMTKLSVPIASFIPGYLLATEAYLRYWFE